MSRIAHAGRARRRRFSLFSDGVISKMLAFPLGILLLMIPLPAIIFNQIVFPLQLVASQAGEMRRCRLPDIPGAARR